MTPLEYISQDKFQGFKPGLERMRALLNGLGEPEKKFRCIHVTGTNGKGSVSSCLASVLTAAGYRTGLYTSPYVICWNERVQVGGEYISDADLADAVEAIRPVADAMEDAPSQFELETAIAFWHFAKVGCEFAVIEVGMGGAWDATNVIPAPEAAVICAMALEHTAVLGKTLDAIARVKAGIIKPGCSVVSYANEPEAEAVFEEVAAGNGCRVRRPDFSALNVTCSELDGITFDFGPRKDLFIPLAGSYQPKNAALAVTTVDVLRERGIYISEDALREGLKNVRWPGRFELLRRDPIFILDGSHNPQGMQVTVESIKLHFPGRKLWFLVGVMADKDVAGIASLLGPMAAGFAAVEPPNSRAMKPAELAALLTERTGVPAVPFDTIADGVRWVAEKAGPDGVCAALGSLYFSNQVRTAVAEL
ncbi:MAG: bifunctional folylpolyglutamate synthase/dihydrofolate synthase [Oscillospiraceae bacterium]|nr:bifunctional folylpolyglutamate synthase/dihydrofolate synthase [Oscillospiraceae bacterium]